VLLGSSFDPSISFCDCQAHLAAPKASVAARKARGGGGAEEPSLGAAGVQNPIEQVGLFDTCANAKKEHAVNVGECLLRCFFAGANAVAWDFMLSVPSG